jgi:hypothetical protein
MSQQNPANSAEPENAAIEQVCVATSEQTAGDLLSFSVGDWFELRGRLGDEPAEYGLLVEKSIKNAFETTPATQEGNARLYMIGLALTRANAWKPGRCTFPGSGNRSKIRPMRK